MRVGNTGQHIPREMLEHLFEPFSAEGRSTDGKAFGLGLWVSYQIVTRLGGTISTSSEPGYTVFEVVLPFAEESDARTKALSY